MLPESPNGCSFCSFPSSRIWALLDSFSPGRWEFTQVTGKHSKQRCPLQNKLCSQSFCLLPTQWARGPLHVQSATTTTEGGWARGARSRPHSSCHSCFMVAAGAGKPPSAEDLGKYYVFTSAAPGLGTLSVCLHVRPKFLPKQPEQKGLSEPDCVGLSWWCTGEALLRQMLYWKQANNNKIQVGFQVCSPLIQPEIAADIEGAYRLRAIALSLTSLRRSVGLRKKVPGPFTAAKGANKQRGGKDAGLCGAVRDK